jgi:hypothetical protein
MMFLSVTDGVRGVVVAMAAGHVRDSAGDIVEQAVAEFGLAALGTRRCFDSQDHGLHLPSFQAWLLPANVVHCRSKSYAIAGLLTRAPMHAYDAKKME